MSTWSQSAKSANKAFFMHAQTHDHDDMYIIQWKKITIMIKDYTLQHELDVQY